MAWTVILEGENGNEITMLPKEFILSQSEIDLLSNENFRILKYLDPFGDTTFNRYMFSDLTVDFIELKIKLPTRSEQIDEIIKLIEEGNSSVHQYLKFYGE